MKKVLVTGHIPGNGLAELERRCEVCYATGEEAIYAAIADCDAVLALGTINRKMIENAPKLKIISNYGAGYDRVDTVAAREHGVIVTNIPFATAQSTAELALTLMLCTLRRVAELDRDIRNNEKCFSDPARMGHNCAGRTLGILGMGRIGSLVAKWGEMLGMKIQYHNRHEVENCPYAYVSLEQLLATSDVLSVNCPLNSETRGMLSRERLALLQRSAVFINTARGAIADYDALCDMLENGLLAGAGIDVYPEEPNVPDRLKALKNVVLTPHVGTHTLEAREGMARAAADKILDVFDGRTPTNIVN